MSATPVCCKGVRGRCWLRGYLTLILDTVIDSSSRHQSADLTRSPRKRTRLYNIHYSYIFGEKTKNRHGCKVRDARPPVLIRVSDKSDDAADAININASFSNGRNQLLLRGLRRHIFFCWTTMGSVRFCRTTLLQFCMSVHRRKQVPTGLLFYRLSCLSPDSLNGWQTNDKIGRFYRAILSADILGEIRSSSTGKFIAEISADKIGRVTYKSRPIFCRPIKSAGFRPIVRLSSALCSSVFSFR